MLCFARCLLLCRYKSVLVSKKWMLKGVTGECNSDELPSHPSPSFPPEAVVEAQLAALRWGWSRQAAGVCCPCHARLQLWPVAFVLSQLSPLLWMRMLTSLCRCCCWLQGGPRGTSVCPRVT